MSTSDTQAKRRTTMRSRMRNRNSDSPMMRRLTLAVAVNLLKRSDFQPDRDTFLAIFQAVGDVPVNALLETESWQKASRACWLKRKETHRDGSDAPPDFDDLGDLANFLERHHRSDSATSKALVSVFGAWCRRQLARAPVGGQADLMADRVAELAQVFKLSELAQRCFTCCFLQSRNHLFREGFTSHCRRAFGSSSITALADMLDQPLTAISREVGSASLLRKFGLLDTDLDPLHHVVEYMQGTTTDPLVSRYFRAFEGRALELAAHAAVGKHVTHLSRLIAHRRDREGLNILFYGEPGTGKTELARSLGQALNYAVYEINQVKDDGEESGTRFRFAALYACMNTVEAQRAMIVVDEADELLNAAMGFSFLGMRMRHGEKNVVNDLMDNATTVLVWITNAHDGIEESTLRRFDYAVEFPKFTLAQRQSVWQRSLEKHQLTALDVDTIGRLARQYPINAGGIDLAVRNGAKIQLRSGAEGATEVKEQVLATMEAVLQAHVKLIQPAHEASAVQENAVNYSLDGLNIEGGSPIGEYVDILRHFCKHQEQHSGSPVAQEVRNMNLLLSGPPGTGKTEFAKYVARELGRPLLVKRASDLLNKYVGESEKRIRAAFVEAQAERAVLFLDEADSLLGGRERASHSWEVSQVNELLSAMEEFNGILICATNFRDNLDQAALRRFNLKVAFDYLAETGRVLFYQRLLAGLVPAALTVMEEQELRQMAYLAPGDFKVARQKYCFVEPAGMTHRRLLDALAAEVNGKRAAKCRRVGFGGGHHVTPGKEV